MIRYAIIRDGMVIDLRSYKEVLRPDQIKHIDGLPMARPIIEMTMPEYDGTLYDVQRRYVILDDKVEEHYDLVELSREQKLSNLREELRRFRKDHYEEVLYALAERFVASLPSEIQAIMAQHKAIKEKIDAI